LSDFLHPATENKTKANINNNLKFITAFIFTRKFT